MDCFRGKICARIWKELKRMEMSSKTKGELEEMYHSYWYGSAYSILTKISMSSDPILYAADPYIRKFGKGNSMVFSAAEDAAKWIDERINDEYILLKGVYDAEKL